MIRRQSKQLLRVLLAQEVQQVEQLNASEAAECYANRKVSKSVRLDGLDEPASVVVEGFYDGPDELLIWVSVDDGGWTAFKPLVEVVSKPRI